jgi:nuclear transport factor 2 (NTF2) superfamily protein
MTAKLRDFATCYTAAWCSQDPARVAAFFSADASLTVNNGTPAVGRGEISELARSFMTTFPDLRIVMDDLSVHEECAVYHWTLIGTNTGPGGRGQRVQISGFEKWRMGTDGLIAASEGHFDSAEYQRQLEQGS